MQPRGSRDTSHILESRQTRCKSLPQAVLDLSELLSNMGKYPKDYLIVDNLAKILEDDPYVKVAGIDVDGILRGKLMEKKKFLSVAKDGFGFCSVVFGWDMHDAPYLRELSISNKENGYRDLIAVPDLESFRRIPWENSVPMFLVRFVDPDNMQPLMACPKSLLKRTTDKVRKQGIKPMAGAEYEFFHFKTPVKDSKASVAAFLKDNVPHALDHITEGMFGYSLTQPVHDQDYYYSVLRTCSDFDCDVESWHPESGPGVLEAVRPALIIAFIAYKSKALKYQEICEMGDRAALFK
jgi:glutamine synthetase